MTNEIYHVFNRSVERRPIFLNNRQYARTVDLIQYYRYANPPQRFSFYNNLPDQAKDKILAKLQKDTNTLVDILAYCLMPNHIHFVLRQRLDNGIATFMRLIEDSYAKYFNLKTKRNGALFESMFKAVLIESDEQLLHVVRYVHLNPLTAYIIKYAGELEHYPWCSFQDYCLPSQNQFTEAATMLSFFSSIESFKDFTLDQLDYQRSLSGIYHLLVD